MSSPFRWRFSDLRIGPKIGLLLAAATAPFLLMTYLFVTQAQRDIAFARLELRGVAYLQALSPVLSGLTQQGGGGLDSALLEKARQQTSAFADLEAATPAVGAFLDASARPDRMLALEAARLAFEKVADTSRLTLDPELESNDLVTVVVERAPELVVSAVGLRRALAYYVRNGRADIPAYGELVGALVRFGRAREGLQAALLAQRDRAGASQAAERSETVEGFLGLAHRLSSQGVNAQTAAESEIPVRGAADLIALADQVIAQGFAISSVSHANLDDSLTARIGRLEGAILRQLSVVAVFFLLAIVVAILILRSIGGPVKQLVGAIRRLQSGDFATAVPYTHSRSELGEIARALEKFQSMSAQHTLTTGIEASQTMLMIIDPDGSIVFMSRGMREALGRFEAQLQARDAAFRVEDMLGSQAIVLFGNPALSATVIESGAEASIVRYDIGALTFEVTTSVIHNAEGGTIGDMAHWQEITAELAAERELAAVVSAASRGDFDTQIAVEGKTGAARDIANGLNQISHTVRDAALDFAETLDAIARGDLTRRIERGYGGIFGKLGEAINQTGERLAGTLATIQQTAQLAAMTATEIRSGAQDLSSRTEDQAHALAHSAATMEEMSASVQTHAIVAREAAQRADQAKNLAERGGSVAGEAVASMARIEEMSRRIDAVTDVIEEIAFQTNLLALNAAVEAARAGESGRGFAVVASEVRTLSQRSSEAAKSIGALLAESSAEITSGVRLVRSVGTALEEIVGASQQLAGAVAGMAGASAEQETGIGQVNLTMEQFDDTTRRNAALAEETLAAVTMLTAQMQELGQLVGGFTVEQAPASPGLAAATRAA